MFASCKADKWAEISCKNITPIFDLICPILHYNHTQHKKLLFIKLFVIQYTWYTFLCQDPNFIPTILFPIKISHHFSSNFFSQRKFGIRFRLDGLEAGDFLDRLKQLSSTSKQANDSTINLPAGKDSQSGKLISLGCDFGGKLESLMPLSIH